MSSERTRQWRLGNPLGVAHAKEQDRARRWAHARLRESHRAEYDALIAKWWDSKARAETRQMRRAS